MAKRGIIVGGGAFGREVLSWACSLSAAERGWEAECFLDRDGSSMSGFSGLPLQHIGDPAEYQPVEGDLFILAIGDPHAKDVIASRLLALGAHFASIIHPTAVVAMGANLGEGVVVGPHSYIATNARLGNFSSVNSLSGIGHDAIIGQSSTMSSQVDIMGRVSLGERCFVGSGARILPGISVSEQCKIGAGSIVVKNLKASSSVFAAPARKI